MELFMLSESATDGYQLTLAELPQFKVIAPTKDAALTALPDALKSFVANWESQVELKSETYQKELPYIQRIKSRGFYQSTLFRIKEFSTLSLSNTIDLEQIHCLQRKDYESLIATS